MRLTRLWTPLALVALMLVASQEVEAGTCSITNLPTTGTLTASRLNARYTQMEGCVNGNLDTTNLSSSAAITPSQLSNGYSYSSMNVQLSSCATKTSAWQGRLPAAGYLKSAVLRCRDCSAADYDIDIQVGGTTRLSFAGVSDATTQTTSGSYSVGLTDDVEIDVTQNTAGSCSALDVTLWFTIQHTTQ